MENNNQVSDEVVKKFKAGLDYETIAQTHRLLFKSSPKRSGKESNNPLC